MDIKHEGLLQSPETFRVLLDVDGAGFGAVLTALNKRSIVALLQIFMILNRARVSGYMVRREGGELVASVQAKEYVEQMVRATSLKSKAPEKPAQDVRLPLWDLVHVRPDKPMTDERAKAFVIEIVIDGAVEKVPVTAPTPESIIALLTAATCEKMPRIAGWNLYDDSGELLASVPAVAFLAQLVEKTPLAKAPASIRDAGWRALPVVAPSSEDLKELLEKARKDGRIPK